MNYLNEQQFENALLSNVDAFTKAGTSMARLAANAVYLMLTVKNNAGEIEPSIKPVHKVCAAMQKANPRLLGTLVTCLQELAPITRVPKAEVVVKLGTEEITLKKLCLKYSKAKHDDQFPGKTAEQFYSAIEAQNMLIWKRSADKAAKDKVLEESIETDTRTPEQIAIDNGKALADKIRKILDREASRKDTNGNDLVSIKPVAAIFAPPPDFHFAANNIMTIARNMLSQTKVKFTKEETDFFQAVSDLGNKFIQAEIARESAKTA